MIVGGGDYVFMGEYEHTIDTKGRVIIPAKFRNQITTPCIVTRGMDHSLTVYPMAEWDKVKERLAQLPSTKGNARKFVRFIFSAATECEFDKQGRINIPPVLRTYAQLTKQCTIIGVSSHFEIWDAQAWAAYQAEAAEEFDEIAEEIEDLSF